MDPAFLYYLLSGPEFQNQLDGVKTHGSMAADYVSLSDQMTFRLSIPPIADQQAVGSVLGALDDKIELNRRMNETLEAMAQALFKSWFIDFDPVLAKMERRVSANITGTTSALFPDRFVHTDLGQVPAGWRFASVRESCEALFDGPHATPPSSDTGPIFLGIKNFTPTRLDLSEVRCIAEGDWPRWTKRVTPQHGDIVFTYEATLGYFALIPPDVRCCLGRRTALIRPSSQLKYSHYLFHWFTAPRFQSFLRAHVKPGSTVDRISLNDFPDYPVLWPTDGLVSAFEQIASSIWSKVHGNQAEEQTLRDLRNMLLPKLLSGTLRIRDAERAVEAVA